MLRTLRALFIFAIFSVAFGHPIHKLNGIYLVKLYLF